jgi:hypothetical protein
MAIALIILLCVLLWLVSLLLFAFSAWGSYKLVRLLWEKIRRALLRPGTAQITAYEIFTPDPEDLDVKDTRPQVRLELDCERHGQRFQISLGPLTCEELFPALDLPAHHVACWLSDEDWRQLLEDRWITIARLAAAQGDPHQPDSSGQTPAADHFSKPEHVHTHRHAVSAARLKAGRHEKTGLGRFFHAALRDHSHSMVAGGLLDTS